MAAVAVPCGAVAVVAIQGDGCPTVVAVVVHRGSVAIIAIKVDGSLAVSLRLWKWQQCLGVPSPSSPTKATATGGGCRGGASRGAVAAIAAVAIKVDGSLAMIAAVPCGAVVVIAI